MKVSPGGGWDMRRRSVQCTKDITGSWKEKSLEKAHLMATIMTTNRSIATIMTTSKGTIMITGTIMATTMRLRNRKGKMAG